MVSQLRIVASRDHSLAGTRAAALEASVTEQGTNLSFGQTRATQQKHPNPIVNPTKLNEIQFATTQRDVDEKHPHHYDETLLGMVTNEALIKVVLALRDNVGPNFITPWETQSATDEEDTEPSKTVSAGPIKGKIQHVENKDIYVTIGSAQGIAINQRFAVYTKGKPVRDIDTGEILTYVPRKIAIITVVDIQTDKISVFRLVEGSDTLKRGDVVQEITAEEEESTPPESQ